MPVSHIVHSGITVCVLYSYYSRYCCLLVAPATYVWDSNPHYRRMRSLLKIVTESKHRVEVISDVLINYIQRGMFLSLRILNLFMFSEWKKARDLLGDESDDYPDSLLRLRRSNLLTFIDALQGDFPLVRQYPVTRFHDS